MHLFIEKEMRSGISYIVKRHSKASIYHIVDLNGEIKKELMTFV